LRAKKVGHQISVSFEKFDVVQALLSLFQLTV
jgi:predicted glycosyltransferase